eukprot:81345_1
MVDELVESGSILEDDLKDDLEDDLEDDSEDDLEDDVEDELVKNIYDIIANCFIFNDNKILMNKGCDWFCSNCGNHNAHLSICILCGIERKESIILNIKNYDTFLMANPRWMRTINDEKNELNKIQSTFDEKE